MLKWFVLCPQNALNYSVLFFTQTAIVYPYNINNQLLFLIAAHCVLCEKRTECLYTMQISLHFQSVNLYI